MKREPLSHLCHWALFPMRLIIVLYRAPYDIAVACWESPTLRKYGSDVKLFLFDIE